MHRQLFHDDSERAVIERVIKQANRRDTRRRFAIPLTALIAFVMSIPMVAQGSSGAAPAQQSPDAAANGVYKVGGDVSAPVVIYTVEPKMSKEALHAHVKGNVLVKINVDKNGNPTHVRVIRGIGPNGVGMGLDESAVETVKQYKFKPAMKNGNPVIVELNIEVHFEAN